MLNSIAGKDLQGFAEQFCALVDQLSHEVDKVRNLEYNREPHTPLASMNLVLACCCLL
jgi:hypothetical protein